MKTLKFKTNINCGGCVSTVTPYLDKLGINWEVDTNHKDKALVVQTEMVSPNEITEAVREAGFEIAQIQPGFYQKLLEKIKINY